MKREVMSADREGILEAIARELRAYRRPAFPPDMDEAIDRLLALLDTESEPVAWHVRYPGSEWAHHHMGSNSPSVTEGLEFRAVYTHPVGRAPAEREARYTLDEVADMIDRWVLDESPPAPYGASLVAKKLRATPTETGDEG